MHHYIKGILDGARAHGAQEGRQEDLEPAPGGGSSSQAFQGKARTLGGDGGEEAAPAAAAGGGDAAAAPPVQHTITFWQNGFTVNDGPLRRYDDPANMPFMQAVTKGQCPRELAPENPSNPININLVRKETEYEVRRCRLTSG